MHLPRNATIGIAAMAGFAAGGGTAYWWMNKTLNPPSIPGGAAAPSKPLDHPALKHGAPKTSTIRVFSDFVLEFDSRLRNPRWVLEHFNEQTMRGDGTRNNSQFIEDGGIDPRFRSGLVHYRGSGYDRGHMAPAATHKGSQVAMDETFVLSNTSPQVGAGFNRDYWARFERFVQELTGRCSDVWVATGPLYLPRPSPTGGWVMEHPMLGPPPAMMAVPTHFYKVILAEAKPSFGKGSPRTVVGAFVMPNSKIDPSVPLSAFSVPLSALEEVAGTSFFPKFLDDKLRKAVDDVSLQWQRLGQAQVFPRLKMGDPLKILPPPTVSDIAVADNKSKVPSKGDSAPHWTPRSLGGGVQHICEHNGCQLPREKWWENGNGKKEGKATLRRTKSSPAL